MTTHQNPINVFLSYAHEDKPLLRKLETHLSSLKRQGLISTWYDRQIVPGTNWAREIDQRLEQASIILLLVSADFLASDYCYQVEMKRAMARHEAGEARVIPIVVRPCDWSHTPFAVLQYLPRDGKAITTWDNRDLAWNDVTIGIRQTIEDLHLGNVPARPRQETEAESKPEPSADRFSVDVCIVCALSDEARAFLEVVRQQCNVDFEERIDSQYKYDYRLTTIKNDKGEPLTLHISWLPRYGPQEMALHLPRILGGYQPRVAIMTGICAGDAQHVQLGDLVVAERIFTYDNGKFTLDEQGRSVHLHDTMTYQLSADILQFLRLFDNWKPLVAHLKRPPYPPEQRKRRKIACHIKAMASGNAVRADHPFEDVQAPVRGTVAIDMEGAAFGLVMSHHPLIRWLIVKGVCDYADQNKNDVYHGYAARASALYALSFIRAYVTNERLPRPDGLSPRSRAGPSGVWNVPHARNPHFTGRDELLDQLHQQLTPAGQNDPAKTRRAALTQPQAIKGLGGIGKTQIAVEYAYCSRDLDRYMHTLWINAASKEAIITSFDAIAKLLPSFSAKDETDHQRLAEAVKRWLEQCEQQWLLIFDNADDLPMIQEYLPQRGNGSALITTRANAVGSLAASIEVENMGLMEGTQFLLHRAQRFDHASDEEINEAINVVIALDHFPLALDQAGAYIEETKCGFVDYLQIYQDHRRELHARRGLQTTNYPDSVATTWSLSFQKVEQANPAAAELLRLCAFLAPDKIPEELIRDGAAYWSPQLQHAAADLFAFSQMIEELLKFSLVQRLVETRMFSIHRLVQAVQMDTIEPEVQRQWAERVIRAVNEVFPGNPKDTATWPQCLRYLDQAQACNMLIGHYMLQLVEAADLLNRTGFYLSEDASYTIAEPLYWRALSICEQQLGPDHPDTVRSRSNLAAFYDTARSLNSHLAALYLAQGKYAKAERLYVRALSICEQQLGPDHPDTARSRSNLAAIYQEQDKYAKAEPLLQRALEITEQQLGPDHPDTARSLNDLAALYLLQGKYTEAESLLQRALSICEQQLGPDHPDTSISLTGLAAIYQMQGKYAEAESLLQRTLSTESRSSDGM